jgi:hypothetical protein
MNSALFLFQWRAHTSPVAFFSSSLPSSSLSIFRFAAARAAD